MRDMNLTYSIFEKQFRQQLNKKFLNYSSENIKILRSAVIDNPTFLRDFELRLPNKFHEIRGLCIIWDSLPETISFEVYLLLLEKIKKFDIKKQFELNILIEPEIRLKYLYLTKRYSSYEVFGNLIFDSIRSLSFIKIIQKSTLVRKPQRKRGYDDKGTLRSYDIWSHNWKPSFDWSLTALQNKYERKHKLQEKHQSSLIKFLREIKLN